ncbi:hypothetical protein LSG31_04390 [Fodinisporobacter ferrooxydans]|uniref:Uncharacterized protein n=1 Tax=Fodinisporobacter ferrooxydans TaxID=2901836 RepID=A0ABY4CLW8_9BACL|nr:hypothetical protein LSG31_04390 [Alicyclobacillaceae bacterium MYW30-H2]
MGNLKKGLYLSLALSFSLPYAANAQTTNPSAGAQTHDSGKTTLVLTPPGYPEQNVGGTYAITVYKDGKVDTDVYGVYDVTVTILNQHYTYTAQTRFEKGVGTVPVNIVLEGPIAIKAAIDKLGITGELTVNVMGHSSNNSNLPPKPIWWPQLVMGVTNDNQALALEYDPIADQYRVLENPGIDHMDAAIG